MKLTKTEDCVQRHQRYSMTGSYPSFQYAQLLSHEKDTVIAYLEKRSQFAESRLLETEMRLAKVMVQVYRDSPRLSRCLMLSNKRNAPSASGTKKGSDLDVPNIQTILETTQTSEAKISESPSKKALLHADVRKWSSLSVHKLAQISDDKLSQSLDMKLFQTTADKLEAGKFIATTNVSDGKSETPARLFGGSLPMLEKLTSELWKTKKELLSVLQEKESTRATVPLQDIKEYEEIIKQLQEDLLLLRCQYTEIRQALQTEHPQHIVHTIGQLQDKVRKQEKIIRLQLSHMQSLKSSVTSPTTSRLQQSVVTTAKEQLRYELSKGENSSISNNHLESHVRNQTASFSHAEATSQLMQANEQIRYIKAELLGAKNVINNLRSKCQMLGEQHEQTLQTLNRMVKLKESQTHALYRKSMEGLLATRQQLKETQQMADFLMAENKELKSLCGSQKKTIANMEANHLEKIDEYEHEKSRSERNFQLLSIQHNATLSELQTLKRHIQGELLRGRPNTTFCGQEIQSPLGVHSRLTEMGLLVDGAKSMDAEDSSLLEPRKEDETLRNLHRKTSSQEQTLSLGQTSSMGKTSPQEQTSSRGQTASQKPTSSQGQTLSQKEQLGEKLSVNVHEVDSYEIDDQLIDKPHNLDEKSKGLSDLCHQETHSNQN